MMKRLISTALAGLIAAWPVVGFGAAPPAPQLPSGLADVGVPIARPFGLVCAGQSNAVGRDGTNSDKTIPANTFVTNKFDAGTSFIVPAFGMTPLNYTAGGTALTTNPTAADNNQCIHFANALRKSGMIPASRPIVVIFNAIGGQPISQWVGSGTASPYFVDLVSSLTAASAAYPGFAIDHVIWDQGEGDNTAGASANNSAALYKTGFTTLLAQWRALPQWMPTTTVSVTELGLWNDNTQQDRNDILWTFRDGLFDPYVTFVSGSGLAESTEAPPYHYAGTGLVTLGYRHFEAWAQARVLGAYHSSSKSAVTGSEHVVPDQLTLVSGTPLKVSMDNLRSGALFIDATVGGTINLPSVAYAGDVTIEVLVGSTAVSFASPSTINFDNANPTTSRVLLIPTNLTNGVYRVTAQPSAATWTVTSDWPRIGGYLLSANSLPTGFTISGPGMRGSIYQITGTISLPQSLTPDGSSATFVCIGSTTCTLVSGGTPDTIFNEGGSSSTNYIVYPNTAVHLEAARGHWFVTSAQMGPPFTVSTLPACTAANKGRQAQVSDATSPTYNGALAGGGGVSVPVYCNGSAWTSP